MINFEQKIAFRDRSSELAMKFELADLLIEFNEISRREGFLYIDDYLDDFAVVIKKNPKDIDFKLMLILLRNCVCGCDEDFIRTIGENYILNSNVTDLEQKLMNFVLEGVISIQQGDNLAYMCEKLASLVGIENYENFFAHINSNFTEKYENKIKSSFDKYFDNQTSECSTISQDDIDKYLNSQNK